MRLGMTAAALGAVLFVASGAYAAPAVNVKGATDASSGLVELAGSKGGRGLGVGGGWAGPRTSGIRGGPKVSSGGGPKMGGYKGGRGGPKAGAYKGGKGYAGKGQRGGDWNRGGKQGGYAWKGGKKYNNRYRYVYPGLGLGLAYGGYSYGDECGWLYRRAQATGSPYWWQRFQECRYYY